MADSAIKTSLTGFAKISPPVLGAFLFICHAIQNSKTLKTTRPASETINLFFKGVAMGAADVVPGVSGGTIAFITGIYQELIDSIKSIRFELIRILRREGFKAFWKALNGNFLLTLFLGIGLSIASLAALMKFLLENYEVLVWAFFFGLILASAIVIGKQVDRTQPKNIAGLVVGAAFGFAITVLTPANTPDASWFIFLSGAIAICAMILPGISGSFILLLLGKYAFIITGLTVLDFRIIGFFGAGAIVGILSFSRLLSWLFANYHQLTISVLTGIMMGSLNKVWPWKETVETTINRHGETIPLVQKNVLPGNFTDDPFLITCIGLGLVGFFLVLVVERGNKKPAEN
jgi:putative membrane protein